MFQAAKTQHGTVYEGDGGSLPPSEPSGSGKAGKFVYDHKKHFACDTTIRDRLESCKEKVAGRCSSYHTMSFLLHNLSARRWAHTSSIA
eukprot:214270-Hanusia_phi.AAC.1